MQSCQNCPANQAVVTVRRQLGYEELLFTSLWLVSCQLLSDKDIEGEHYFQLLIYNHILDTIKQHSLHLHWRIFEGGKECDSKLLILQLENSRVGRKQEHEGPPGVALGTQ